MSAWKEGDRDAGIKGKGPQCKAVLEKPVEVRHCWPSRSEKQIQNSDRCYLSNGFELYVKLFNWYHKTVFTMRREVWNRVRENEEEALRVCKWCGPGIKRSWVESKTRQMAGRLGVSVSVMVGGCVQG